MSEQQGGGRGVADIVFLVDASGSMSSCIDGLKTNIGVFVDTLTTGGANNDSPLSDWRARVIGYRDVESDGSNWFVDQPFVRDAAALKAQLAALTAEGGGDEPESLLDALYRVATLGGTESGAQEDDTRWRHRREALRMVIVFSDASFHSTMRLEEVRGGTIDDLSNQFMTHRIVLSLFAPSFPCYDELATIQRSEYNVVPGTDPQRALEEFTRDHANFARTLRQLAQTVSKSASVAIV